MKKLNALQRFGVGVLVGLTTLLPFLCSAASLSGGWKTEEFLTGQWLQLSNGVQYIYNTLPTGGTNLFYVDNKGLGHFALTNINVVPTIGQNNTNYIQAANLPALYYTNNNALYQSTNAFAGGTNQPANIINPWAWQDIPGFVDANADNHPGVILSVFLPATNNADYPLGAFGSAWSAAGAGFSLNTNTVSMTFVKVPYEPTANATGNSYLNGVATPGNLPFNFGPPPMPLLSSLGNDYFQVTVGPAYGTNYLFQTNVPSAFLAGARYIRLLSITSTSGTGTSQITNCYIRSIAMTAWQP